jgi:hypothetical protein
MSEKSVSHTIKLTQGALRYLHDFLGAVGWAKTTSDIVIGGSLLAEILPAPPAPPVTDIPKESTAAQVNELRAKHEADTKQWRDTPAPEFDLNDKQRDAVRRCLKHFAEQAQIPSTPQAATLLRAFGYGED